MIDWQGAYLKAAGYPDTPKNRSFLASWQRWEGGHTNNTARWNYLNTTQDMSGNPTMNSIGVRVYRSLDEGARAFAKTIKNGRYGDLDAALLAGDPYTKKAVDGLSVWLAGKVTPSGIAYASRILGTHAPAESSVGKDFVNDDAGTLGARSPDQLREQALQGLQDIGTGKKTSTDALGDLGRLTESLSKVPDVVPTAQTPGAAPGSDGAATAGFESHGDWSKWVTLADGADRPGVHTQEGVLQFVGTLGASVGKRLTIGTGTNHNQMTTSGNVSDHWRGDAGDIPATGDFLTKLGYNALIQAGMPKAQALKAARKGGLFNIGGYQIIFKTTIGGNHWNHLHVGLEAGRG